MEITSEMVRVAEEAMYRALLGHAISDIDRLNFESSDLRRLSLRLRGESETTQILVMASFLEDRFMTLLRAQLVEAESQSAFERVFGSNGPLSTFGNRTTMAFHLGWLSKRVVERLGQFRKIRNAFAHNAFRVSLSSESLAPLFLPLRQDLQIFCSKIEPLMSLHDKEQVQLINQMSESEIALSSLTLLIGRTFQDLMVLPFAVKHHVCPDDLMRDAAKMPRVVRALMENVINAVFFAPLEDC